MSMKHPVTDVNFSLFRSSILIGPYFHRLLDITHGQRRQREMSLHLIFEHVDGDLAAYLEKCPAPGLPLHKIKVCLSLT